MSCSREPASVKRLQLNNSNNDVVRFRSSYIDVEGQLVADGSTRVDRKRQLCLSVGGVVKQAAG